MRLGLFRQDTSPITHPTQWEARMYHGDTKVELLKACHTDGFQPLGLHAFIDLYLKAEENSFLMRSYKTTYFRNMPCVVYYPSLAKGKMVPCPGSFSLCAVGRGKPTATSAKGGNPYVVIAHPSKGHMHVFSSWQSVEYAIKQGGRANTTTYLSLEFFHPLLECEDGQHVHVLDWDEVMKAEPLLLQGSEKHPLLVPLYGTEERALACVELRRRLKAPYIKDELKVGFSWQGQVPINSAGFSFMEYHPIAGVTCHESFWKSGTVIAVRAKNILSFKRVPTIDDLVTAKENPLIEVPNFTDEEWRKFHKKHPDRDDSWC